MPASSRSQSTVDSGPPQNVKHCLKEYDRLQRADTARHRPRCACFAVATATGCQHMLPCRPTGRKSNKHLLTCGNELKHAMRITAPEGGVPVAKLGIWRWVPEVAHMQRWFEGYHVRKACCKLLNLHRFQEAVEALVHGHGAKEGAATDGEEQGQQGPGAAAGGGGTQGSVCADSDVVLVWDTSDGQGREQGEGKGQLQQQQQQQQQQEEQEAQDDDVVLVKDTADE